jgi:hypothetical protein
VFDTLDEDGRSYRYFLCWFPPFEDFELVDEARLEVGLRGVILSRISLSSWSSESISRAILSRGDMPVLSSVLLSASECLAKAAPFDELGRCDPAYGLFCSSSEVGGVGGVLAGACCTLCTCSGTAIGDMSYCCTV